jgi:ribosomal protein S18 acetylase RimI-like enzyme
MLDARSVILAFEGVVPVGYVHTAFAPDKDGYSFDYTTGQICFLCVDPEYRDIHGAAAELIRAGEDYLIGLGAQKIFGGSPLPSAPFYTGFYGGGEAVGFLHSDKAIINAFHAANYQVHQSTVWFHFDIQTNATAITEETVGYYSELDVEISEVSNAKTWWEGCALANGIWFDATAYMPPTKRPIARLRTRIAYPDPENVLMMYGGTWLASLIELRVHPDFVGKGVALFLLGELIQYLADQNQVIQVEAHVAEGSSLFALLRNQMWHERDSGSVFVKNR